jgi:hypothetical protein
VNGVNTVTVNCGTYVVAGSTLNIDQNVKVLQNSGCTTGVTFILTNSRPGANDYAQISSRIPRMKVQMGAALRLF